MRLIGEMITHGARYYKELNDRVNQVARTLLKTGIWEGDRVGIQCYN